MFTGIIKVLGRVGARAPLAGGMRLAVAVEEASGQTSAQAPAFAGLEAGESIAVNGVCLTAEAGSAPGHLQFFLSDETLARSSLAELREGELVNLERAMALGERFGGHLVLGHVDAVGEIAVWERAGEAWNLSVMHPPALAACIAEKGSVTVDGISLTVVQAGPDSFTAAIVPHTVQMTNLRETAPGRSVNLEVDALARYVLRALEVSGRVPTAGALTESESPAHPREF